VLSDQLDDLAGGGVPAVMDAIAIEVWRSCAEMLLVCAGWWGGTGKWLIREVQALDVLKAVTTPAVCMPGYMKLWMAVQWRSPR
jgi:hypothetical protein